MPAAAGYFPGRRHGTFQVQDAYGRSCPFRCPLYEVPANERPRYEDSLCPVAEERCDRRNIELKIHPPATLTDMEDIAVAIRKGVGHVEEITG